MGDRFINWHAVVLGALYMATVLLIMGDLSWRALAAALILGVAVELDIRVQR